MAIAAAPLQKPLKGWQKLLMKLAIPVLLAMFTIGAAGLLVLSDKHDKYWLTRSQFGQRWRALIQYNPIFSMFFVNGSMLALLLIAHTFSQDAKTRKLETENGEAPAAAKPKTRRAKKAD